MDIKTIYETMEYGPAPESRSIADEWLKSHAKLGLFIDGKWQKPSSNQYFDSIDPANHKKLLSIAQADKKDVDKAVAAARKALPAWIKAGPHVRARYLYAIARLIQKHARLFSVLESIDNGKPIRETRDIDIPLVARHFYHHAGWAQLMPEELADYQEIGVIGQVIPWNFPLLMLAWKVAPALAMGNTLVLKPAEFTSISAMLFAEICEQAGLPAGVVNVISGDGKTGAAIVEHPGVDKIAFTGSTEVGRIIRRATAGSGKKISLELGGKSPFIVFEDADIDGVVEGLVDAIWFNQGQVCCAGSRLLVQEDIADKVFKKIKARMEKLRVGSPLDKSMDIGAIVAPVQLKTIESLVKIGVKEGATLWQPSWKCPDDGCFYPPTLFTDVAPSHTIAREEIFGPVLVAMTFRTHEEAVKLANNTRYGLAASVWTENINLALDVAPKLKAGTVWINCSNIFDAASGFGGYRESGFGREGGKEGLFEYVKPRVEKEFSDLPFTFGRASKNGQKAKSAVVPEIDRTIKLYIGGKQARPDGGYSNPVFAADGSFLADVADGNRKDVRNAVEAAHAASKWTLMSGHARAQVLYYFAENMALRREELAKRIESSSGCSSKDALLEVDLSIDRVYTYAAYADKYDGRVHNTITGNVTLAMPEAIGVLGVICPDEFPLLSAISTIMPAIAMGNRVVVIPSETMPVPAMDLYQLFDTSDLPGGVVNLISGNKDVLAEVLANHDDVDGIWYFGTKAGSKKVEFAAAENMKRTWVNYGKHRNWTDEKHASGAEFLRHATEIKNIWVPYGH
jgi:aldehyde dehydrogenase (NAD+)